MFFIVQWPDGYKGIYEFFDRDGTTLDLDQAFRLRVCTCGMCNFHKHGGRAGEGVTILDDRYNELGIDDARKALASAETLEDAAINIYELLGNLQNKS